jgi:predicted type IV restriction endonuclease
MIFTKCPNEECSQKYKIKSALLGQQARCKRCSTVFEIEEHVRKPVIIDLGDDEESEPVEKGAKKKRRSRQEVMEEHIENIQRKVNDFIPRLEVSLENNENESDTRLLINKMLQQVLGYKLEDIKTEQNVEGRRADYVLSVNNKESLVIEAKKIGMALRDRQIFQATSYGAYSGINWVILTNAMVWQLYHIATEGGIKTDLVFNIDLRDGLDDEEAQHFYLISKHGMSRKGLIDKVWQKISALCYDNIVTAIFTDDVISKIRTTLSKQTGCRLNNEELRDALEENILQLN